MRITDNIHYHERLEPYIQHDQHSAARTFLDAFACASTQLIQVPSFVLCMFAFHSIRMMHLQVDPYPPSVILGDGPGGPEQGPRFAGRKTKKIGNMSLKSQKVAGAEQNMWL